MIQRIQSLWLLLAAVAAALLFYLPFYSGSLLDNTTKSFTVQQFYLLFIVTALLVIIPLVAIFQFKKRGTQKGLIWAALLLHLVFLVLLWTEVSKITGENNFTDHGYKAGALMPIVAIVFLVLGRQGIRRDEKLLKEATRLR